MQFDSSTARQQDKQIEQAGKRQRDRCPRTLTWVADVLGHHVHLFDNAATELEIEGHLDLRKQVDVAVVQ